MASMCGRGAAWTTSVPLPHLTKNLASLTVISRRGRKAMPSITEGALTFQFPDGWQATKFDDWRFYRNQFQKVCGAKAIDMLVIASDHCMWVIEVKDYRVHPRTKTIALPDEVACKVRDSLAALVAARVNANDE